MEEIFTSTKWDHIQVLFLFEYIETLIESLFTEYKHNDNFKIRPFNNDKELIINIILPKPSGDAQIPYWTLTNIV